MDAKFAEWGWRSGKQQMLTEIGIFDLVFQMRPTNFEKVQLYVWTPVLQILDGKSEMVKDDVRAKVVLS